jgi:hypothetical protein
MSQVNNFGSFVLEYPAHDVYSYIMTIKKRGCSNNTDFILKLVTHSKLNTKNKVNENELGFVVRIKPG